MDRVVPSLPVAAVKVAELMCSSALMRNGSLLTYYSLQLFPCT